MTCKILIVDDEPDLAEELRESLEFDGFDAQTANSVDEALRSCAQTDYDLVVTDLKMPIRGGLDLIRELAATKNAPIIFVLSGHGAESNRSEAKSLGAVECFAKPVDPDDLSDCIRAVCT